MPLTSERKGEIIQSFRRHEQDSGSPEVQVAILSERISHLFGRYAVIIERLGLRR